MAGVDYWHSATADGGDLYLTRFGLPFARQLQPDNWLPDAWFNRHSRRLRGTSAIYRTPTKPVDGRSLDLIVRFSRVGQELPIDTITRDQFTHASFNSPFEEFGAAMELRRARVGPQRRRILLKQPLAIYSPGRRVPLWQSGRDAGQMAAKQARLPGAPLDLHRSYLLVYGWIKGIDVQEAVDRFVVQGSSPVEALRGTVAEVEAELAEAGWRVIDMKPAHIIVRFGRDGRFRRRREGRLVYALIDYELLERL